MKTSLGLALAGLVASLSLCGCFKMKQHFTVNPDGSGKVTCEISIPGEPDAGKDLATLKEEARQRAAKIVSETQGVTAWKDVAFSADKDGTITCQGTAYFKDITKFKTAPGLFPFRWKPGADGAVQLEFVVDFDQEPAPKEARKLTEEEIKQKIADAKAQMMQELAMRADVRIEWTFTLPGPVVKSVNFQAVADKLNTVRLVLDGKKMVEFVKDFSEDEAAMRAKIRGQEPAGPPDRKCSMRKSSERRARSRSRSSPATSRSSTSRRNPRRRRRPCRRCRRVSKLRPRRRRK